MSTALDNLLANAGQNNMLGVDGMLRQNEYWRRYLQNQANPALALVAGAGALSSSNDWTAPTQIREPNQFRDYYNYWKEDGASGRNIAQAGNLITGLPITSLTDYAMGKNPAGDIGSYIGSGLLGSQARNLQEAIALSNVGGMAGQYIGKQIQPGTWREYHPGRTTAEALGYQEGSKVFDAARDISMEVITEKLKQGKTLKEIEAEFEKEAKEFQPYTGPVQVEEKSTGYGMQAPGESLATDYAGVITEIEPSSVSDFAGMFSSTIDGVGDWFSNAYDSLTGQFTGMQSNKTAPLTYAEQMSRAYGAESDPYGKGYEAFGSEGDATSRDASGTTWHSSDYNWGSTDGGASEVSGGTDFSPSNSDEETGS